MTVHFTVDFTIPWWVIVAYLAVGAVVSAVLLVLELRQVPIERRELRTARFWSRFPLITFAVWLIWPWAAWEVWSTRRRTRKNMTDYKARVAARENW